jgi:hypothetical protein
VRSGATADAYESLVQGKVAFQRRDFVTALEKFRESAERGNAEAMLWIAKIVAEGLAGRAPDKVAALDWLRRAAERGDINAMKNLIAGLREAGPEQDLAEAARWEATLMQAELVAAELNIFDPSGEAGRGEPTIPAEATVVRFPQPAAPTGLRAQ